MFHRPTTRDRIARLLRVASTVALAIFVVRPTSPAQENQPSSGQTARPCADRCKADYDRAISLSLNLLKTNGYWVGLASSNCGSRWGTPPGQPDPCWQGVADCRATCSGANYQACMNSCNATFQQCCHQSATINAQAIMDMCLKGCPPGEGAAAKLPIGREGGSDLRPAWSLDTELAQTPTVDEMARRIAGTNAFIIAVDENGRPYVIDNSGRRRDLSTLPVLTDRFKLGGRFDVLSDQGRLRKEIADLIGDAAAADTTVAGITGADEAAHARTLSQHEYILFDETGLKHYLPGGQVIVASSDLGERGVTGTINGGGDFVKADRPRTEMEWTQFHGEGPSVSFDPTGTKFAVEVGYNGVSAIAVLEGTVKVTERATGRATSVPAGSAVVSVPGRGVTRVFPLSSQASASLGRPLTSPVQDLRGASSAGWNLTGTCSTRAMASSSSRSPGRL